MSRLELNSFYLFVYAWSSKLDTSSDTGKEELKYKPS